MPKYIYTLLCSIIVLISSCKKDAEKHLTRNDGEWIYTFVYKQTASTRDVLKDDKGNGAFNINKDGRITQTENGVTNIGEWTISDNKITLIFPNYTRTYNIVKVKKNKQTWEYKNEVKSQIGTTTTNLILELSAK
jgi:hypothetical protein